jgi:Transglutaminase-like superfamily
MGLAAKLLRLDRRDRALLFAAARTLAVTLAGLRTIGFNRVGRKASRMAGQNSKPHSWCGPPPKWSVSRPSVDKISWAVRAASRFIPGASNCLVRALATQSLLGHYGYSSELRIGVRKAEESRLAAHAWLENAGEIVIGEFELENYVPLAGPGIERSDSTRSDSTPTGSTA